MDEKYFQCSTIPSLTMRVYLHSFSRCCLPNMPTSAKFRENLNLQQFKVIQGRWFWYQSKAHMRLPIGPISCTVSEIRRLIGWKLCIFPTPLSFGAPAPYVLFGISGDVNREKTRIMGLVRGGSCMILTATVFDWSTRVTDRRTDRRTDGR